MKLLLILPLLLFGVAHAQDCAKAITTLEINQCANISYTKADSILNEKYKEIIKYFNDQNHEKFLDLKNKFIDSQKAWISFRDKSCNFVYEYYLEGTIRTVMKLGCMEKLTQQRVEQFDLILQRN